MASTCVDAGSCIFDLGRVSSFDQKIWICARFPPKDFLRRYLGGSIAVQYAYKKDGSKGERHGRCLLTFC